MFSIVIPLYNKAYSIERCLNSVFQQTFTEFQIVIVNDGSKDDSLSIVKNIIDNNPFYNITLINQNNKGVSYTRNIAVDNAIYEYICFLDADDSWDHNYLYEMSKLIEIKSEAALFISGYRKYFNDVFQQNYILQSKDFEYINFFEVSAKFPVNATSSTIIRKNVFIELKGFPVGVSVSEDLYLWARLAEKFKVAYLSKPLINHYYEHDDSRDDRSQSVPYILEYYSQKGVTNDDLKGFLKYVYIAHLNDSYRKKNTKEFKNRFKVGFSIFPIFSLISLPLLIIPVGYLKRLRNVINR